MVSGKFTGRFSGTVNGNFTGRFSGRVSGRFTGRFKSFDAFGEFIFFSYLAALLDLILCAFSRLFSVCCFVHFAA